MAHVQCPVCESKEAADPAMGSGLIPLQKVAIFSCDACGARAVWGVITPRIVIEPHTDANGLRWIRVRHQDPKTRLDIHVADFDPNLAIDLVRNIMSLVETR